MWRQGAAASLRTDEYVGVVVRQHDVGAPRREYDDEAGHSRRASHAPRRAAIVAVRSDLAVVEHVDAASRANTTIGTAAR